MKKLTTIAFIFFFTPHAFSLSVTITTTKDFCNHSNGTMTANASGGTAPYTYLWSNGATSQMITGLSAGTTRTVTVTDNIGSTATATATIQAQAHLGGAEMTWEVTNPCEGMCNGLGHISEPALDGVPPYWGTFNGNPLGAGCGWAGSLNANNVCWNGSGIVYISDATGCDTSWYEQVTYIPYPVINSITVTPACGGNTGVAIVYDNELYNYGGSYCYRLQNSSGGVINYPNSTYISGLAPGTYSFQLMTLSLHCVNPFMMDTCSIATQAFTIAGCSLPTNLTTTNITSTKATLNWNTNDCAVGYRIQYKQSGNTWITKNVSSNIGYKTIKGLLPNSSYVWKVRTKCSINPVVFSSWSETVSFNTTMKLAEAEDKEEAALNIFPNPTSGRMSVKIDPATTIRVVMIQNLVGRILLQKNFPGDSNNEVEMDVSTLPAGAYLLTAFTNEERMMKMFVKE